MKALEDFINRHKLGFSIFSVSIGLFILLLVLFISPWYLSERTIDNKHKRELEVLEMEMKWRSQYGNDVVNSVFSSYNTNNINNVSENYDSSNTENAVSNPIYYSNSTWNAGDSPIKGNQGDRFALKYYEKINAGNQSGYVMIVVDKANGKEFILYDSF